MADKKLGGMNFDGILSDLNKMANQVSKGAENVKKVAGDAGDQVVESFVNNVGRGIDEAANQITASSVKITKAFRDLAKKITNQKDIFSVSLGSQNIALDIDFSDVDINSEDFKRRVDEVFEKFKIDNAIKFDSKAAEKQFKDMLGLHIKYAEKLSNLQAQAAKPIKTSTKGKNAQSQLAVMSGLEDIQDKINKAAGKPVKMPRVYLEDSNVLKDRIHSMETELKVEERVGKQRDTNAGKRSKEIATLKNNNEEIMKFALQFGSLQKEMGASDKFTANWNNFLKQVQQGALTAAQAVAKLREEMTKTTVAAMREAEANVGISSSSDAKTEAVANQKKITEETTNIEAKANEQSVVAEQTKLDLTKEELKVEKEITAENEKQAASVERLKEIKKGMSMAEFNATHYDKNIDFNQDVATSNKSELLSYLGDNPEQTENELKLWKQQIENRIKPVNETVSRISKMSAVPKELNTTKLLYQEAAKVGQQIQTMYDDGITDTEEYIALQYKLLKIFDKIAYAYGGVKGSGAKDRTELNQWMYNALKEDTGFDFYGGSLVDALYSGQNSIYDDKGKKLPMKDKVANLLNYDSGSFTGAFGFDQDLQDLQEINTLLDIIEKRRSELFNKSESTNSDVKPNFIKTNDTPNKFKADQGVQTSMDNMLPASAEDIIPKAESETEALGKVGEAAERAAESKNKLADANKKVAASVIETDDEGGKNIWTTSRSGESLDTLNLPVRYVGENGQDAVQMFAGLKSQIEEMTGRPVTIDFSSNVGENGQLEAIGATLKYVNEEAGVTVKQFYDIERGEGDMLIATQSYEKATLSATKAAKNFNVEMQRKVAEAQIKTLETQMGELKLDLTDVKKAASDINDQASLDKFNLELKAAKEEAKQLKAELKGQNALDTIATMERSALALPSELERIKRKLEELGNVNGAEAISDVLKSVEEEYNKFLTTDESEDKTKAFRSLSTSITWIKAEMKNLSDLNSKQKKQETQVEKEELAKQKAARESYINWWKSTLNAQSQEEAVAQKKVNDTYKEYIDLINRRGKYQKELVGLDPEKDKESINRITADINEIDEKLNKTYGDLLSNKIAQATLTLEDFMKYYDKWQREIADKEAKAADKARNKEEKPYRDYGKTTANSAVRKRDNLQGEIDALGVTNPEILAQIDAYKDKVQQVVDLREKFAKDPNAAKNPELVGEFQKISAEAERARKSIKSVIDEEQKMARMSEEQGFSPVELSVDQIANLKNTMIDYAKSTKQGRVEIKGWNDDNTKMYYTVTNSKGAVEEMTMAIGQGTNKMYQYRTATKETGTLFQQVFKGIKVKAKELLSFVIGGGSIYKVISIFRQGIQYVREIDLALTELKKVTDETEESYDRFLETAAKTAEKVGSTIQKVVSSTADWARLNI